MLLNENYIRPIPNNPTLLQKARQADIHWLLSKQQSFVHVVCPACETAELSASFNKDGFTFGWCKNCKTLYMPKRPSATLLGEFYHNSATVNYFAEVIFPASHEQRIKNIYEPRSENIIKHAKKHGCHNYAEVGAGSGVFARVLQEKSYFSSITAIEPNVELAKQCQKNNIPVINKPIEAVNSTEITADIITSFEVLEHLFSPKDFLCNIANILPKNGLLIVTTPNGLSLDVLELKEASSAVGMTHLTLFNPQSISTLLQSCGFSTIDITTPGRLDHSLLHNYYIANPPAKETFLSYLLNSGSQEQVAGFQEYLQNFQLSSHMQVIAKRV